MINSSKPRFILSRQKVLAQFDLIQGLADVVSYSSKTNPLVTQILEKERDCLFSIHLMNELQYVTDKSRVLFLAQGWSAEEITLLLEQGVIRFAVDNESDLVVLQLYLRTHAVKLHLFLRVRLKERSLKTERYYVFGMPTKVVEDAVYSLRKEFPDQLLSLGIHFHRKTQNMSEWNLKYEVEQMFSAATFQAIDVVNIGGGLPSQYANTNGQVLPGIVQRISEMREWLVSQQVELMVEPGRFIAAPSCTLHTKISAVDKQTIIVNASVYNSDMDALIVPVKLLVEGELKKGEGQPYIIKGCTPCSMDLFRYRVYLQNPQLGDTLIFLNAGAYNFHSDFCSLDRIETEIM